jgi:Fe-S cluster assembly iron-binding protein IscA
LHDCQKEDNIVIEITDAAKKELKRILNENTQDPAMVLRLTATPEGSLGLMLDNAAEGDNMIEHDGVKVLVVDGELGGMMNGVSMDVEETDEGPMLTFRGDCGCGDSSCGGGSCCGDHGGCGDSKCG